MWGVCIKNNTEEKKQKAKQQRRSGREQQFVQLTVNR
jgi:hypothetical protein